MKNQNVIIAVVVVAVIAIAYLFMSRHKGEVTESEIPGTVNVNPAAGCPGPKVELEMQDVYLRGMLEQGQKFHLITNYYACNKPSVGDIVGIATASGVPRIRIVRAIEGDSFHLVQDKKNKAWNIKINDDLLMAGDEPYFFGAPTPPTLALVERERKKGLLPGEVLLFSSFPPGDGDSGIFGVYSTQSLVGKVEQ